MGRKERKVVANLQPLVEDWRVGRKERKVVTNLQPPAEDLRMGMGGKESGY